MVSFNPECDFLKCVLKFPTSCLLKNCHATPCRLDEAPLCCWQFWKKFGWFPCPTCCCLCPWCWRNPIWSVVWVSRRELRIPMPVSFVWSSRPSFPVRFCRSNCGGERGGWGSWRWRPRVSGVLAPQRSCRPRPWAVDALGRITCLCTPIICVRLPCDDGSFRWWLAWWRLMHAWGGWWV